MDDLSTGSVDQEHAESARGLGDWQPLPDCPGHPSRLSETDALRTFACW
ncbi:hypothetical protein ACIHCQ_14915 [Streptomyces sp. NPDC052236]